MNKIIVTVLSFIFCFSFGLSSCAAKTDSLTTESTQKKAADLTLKYDDRYSFDGKTVKSISTNEVSSYQVGYGIAANSVKDTDVLTKDETDSSKVVATGVGTATVTFADDTTIDVAVESAKLGIFFLIGQSNAEGVDGKYDQSIANDDGTTYSTYGPNNAWSGKSITGIEHQNGLSVDTASSFVGASLTGSKNVNGEELTYGSNGLCVSGGGKGGLDSGIAYQWHKTTGEKSWIINAGHSGTSIKLWDPDGDKTNEYYQAITLFKYAKQTAKAEFEAGHYTLSHMNYIWMQGESDFNMSAEEYTERYTRMHNALKNDMQLEYNNISHTAEYGAIIATRVGNRTPMFTYNDIYMVGPRISQNYMANSPEFADIFMVSNIGDTWVQNDSQHETGKLKEYFDKYYPDGVLNYPTQSGEANVIPTSSANIHYGYHYSQVGYNEIGMDISRSMTYIWKYAICADKAEIKLLALDGHTEYADVIPFTEGKKITVIPVISPVWNTSEKLSVTYSGNTNEITSEYEYAPTKTETITYTLSDGTSKTITLMKIKYGDANDDGVVNSKDVLLLRKHMAGISVNINTYAADVVTNGKITTVDLLNLRKYLAGFSIVLGPAE